MTDTLEWAFDRAAKLAWAEPYGAGAYTASQLRDALDDFKADDNVVRQVDGEWQHYCKDCAP